MKPKSLFRIAMAVLVALVLTAPVQAKHHKSFFEMAGAELKFTPGDFRPAPEIMHTRFGVGELLHAIADHHP